MKKIIGVVLMIVIFFSRPVTVHADEKKDIGEERYKISVKVLDETGEKIRLAGGQFYIENKERFMEFSGKTSGKSGRGFGEKFDAKVKYYELLIETTIKQKVHFVMSFNVGEEHVFIEDTIPVEKFKGGETLELEYRIDYLKEITLKRKEYDENMRYYICNLFVLRDSEYDPRVGAWGEFGESLVKKVYVNKSMFDIYFETHSGNNHKIFAEKYVLIYDDTDIEIDSESREYNKYTLNISDIYHDYDYYKIGADFEEMTVINIWNKRDEMNSISIYVDEVIELDKVRVYLSNNKEHIYGKSVHVDVQGKVNLGDKYHYGDIYLIKEDKNKYDTMIFVEDNKGNELSFIDIGRPKDVYMEIYRKGSQEKVFEGGFSSYWATLNFDFDKNDNYTIKLSSNIDTNVNGVSYYDLRFDEDENAIVEFEKVVFHK